MAKKNFTNTPLNPFANAKAAAESVIGVTAAQNVNDETNDDKLESDKSFVESNSSKDTADNYPPIYHNKKDENTPSDYPLSYFNKMNKEPAPKIKKSRCDKDKEKGRQHLHVILPAYQVEAIKGMAISTGMSLTDFLTKTFDAHLKGDWKPLLEQYHMSQKKLGFDVNPTSKEILGL